MPKSDLVYPEWAAEIGRIRALEIMDLIIETQKPWVPRKEPLVGDTIIVRKPKEYAEE